MELADRTYFIQRAGEERAAADAAKCEAAKIRHLQLAAAYESRSNDSLAILPLAPDRVMGRRMRQPAE